MKIHLHYQNMISSIKKNKNNYDNPIINITQAKISIVSSPWTLNIFFKNQ